MKTKYEKDFQMFILAFVCSWNAYLVPKKFGLANHQSIVSRGFLRQKKTVHMIFYTILRCNETGSTILRVS